MGKSGLCLVTFLLALGLAAAPARATDVACYQPSDLPFFHQVVEIVSAGPDFQHGCWSVQLRLRGRTSPQGHAMICGGNACDQLRDLREGIYWWRSSAVNENIKLVTAVENRNCTDMSFCIVPKDVTETMLIHFVAFFEESYFQSLSPTFRPRWSDGVIDLSSLDGLKSHCQDGEPRGAVCLEF